MNWDQEWACDLSGVAHCSLWLGWKVEGLGGGGPLNHLKCPPLAPVFRRPGKQWILPLNAPNYGKPGLLGYRQSIPSVLRLFFILKFTTFIVYIRVFIYRT